MLRRLIYPVVFSLTLLFTSGCTITVGKQDAENGILPVKTDPFKYDLPEVIQWSVVNGVKNAPVYWIVEANKRFRNPVIFVCHGGYEYVTKNYGDYTVSELEWWVYPDPPREPMSAQEAANTLANLYPDKDIVFVVCNILGHNLTTKRVFYGKKDVWVVPDNNIENGAREKKRGYDGVGSIWEFVSYDGRLGIPNVTPLVLPTSRPTTLPSFP